MDKAVSNAWRDWLSSERALTHIQVVIGQTLRRVHDSDLDDLTAEVIARLLPLGDRYDPSLQQAAFSLFVQATTLGVPVIAAGRLPPVDLPVRDDLRSRLGWGLVYQLVPPSEDQVRALLRREGDRRGILLSDDVVDYLLKRCARDLSHLMQLLDRLDQHALAAKRAVTLPLVRQVLAELEQA